MIFNGAWRLGWLLGGVFKRRVLAVFLGFALALAAIAVAAPVNAGATISSSSSTIVVSGSGVRGPSAPGDSATAFKFSFNAQAPRAPGTLVDGGFSGKFAHDANFRSGTSAPGNFAKFSGVVTCLKLNGRTATIGGVMTSGHGYDSDTTSPDSYSQNQQDLTGDWFIATAHDPWSASSPDTVGYVDWGDRTYFLSASYGYTSFSSMCLNPAADLGTTQFPLLSGDLKIHR